MLRGGLVLLVVVRRTDRLAWIDDVRRNEDQQVALFLTRIGLREQATDQRQVRQQRDTGAVLDDLGLRQAADDRGLAVVDEELRIRVPLRDREAQVTAD